MRRWLTRILICLLLGAVTTVGVAWGFSAFKDPRGEAQAMKIGWRSFLYLGEGERFFAMQRRLGAGDQTLLVWTYKATDPHGPFVNSGGTVQARPLPWFFQVWQVSDEGLFQIPFEARPWFDAQHASTDSLGFGSFQEYRVYTSWGWPKRCAWTAFEWDQTTTAWGLPDPAAAILTGTWSSTPEYDGPLQRALPLRPIWSGFLVDTLVYGVLWFGLIFGFGAAKRILRTRRGRCPMCAYDLRGCPAGLRRRLAGARSRASPRGCPECGWNRSDDPRPGETGG